ncbi:hypothetical protein CHL78_000880 [Romboutsia weinsteinii]|uniref:Uncharacterized protein n=1 Tax=Romboutsia weinsteinii TaxID=2020949 RepID=A0A371JAQ6_9FIRM|nr:hypothetical protein [Romboutsia weinsteinii]RDY29756.1 hypothetical protein CHL78_000880 [Romboutsia weinsteinii]
MKYEVITSPFYCTALQIAFIKGQIVEIKNTKRAGELVDAGLLAVVDKKKSTRKKKVNKDV